MQHFVTIVTIDCSEGGDGQEIGGVSHLPAVIQMYMTGAEAAFRPSEFAQEDYCTVMR